jgi:predicted transcriptional regulator
MSEEKDQIRNVSGKDFEKVVDVIGNPIRRRIIQKLSEGPDYALRLSNELKIHHLYNQRLISFNKPHLWITADNYMDKLEDKVMELIEEESGVDTINPLSHIVQSIDDELGSLEKHRARLLYIRNLAMNASVQALEDLDRKKRQIIHYVLNQGSASIESISSHMQLREQTIKELVDDLEHEDILKIINNMVTLAEIT